MRNSWEKVEKMLDKMPHPLYNLKAVKNAAIAQSVERILGKDEVASSNLASSSIILDSLSAAIAQSVERILGKDEVASSNLASSSRKRPRPFGLGLFLYPLEYIGRLAVCVSDA